MARWSMFLAVWIGLLVMGMVGPAAQAADWPQWLGPNRDGVWPETGITRTLPKEDSAIKWRTPIAGGYAGPAVAQGRVYVTDYVRTAGEAFNNPGRRARLQGKERVLCLSAETGEILWKHEYDCPYEISYPAGPRATPTVDGDRVYTLGAEGHLLCLNAKTGQVLWSKQLRDEYKTRTPIWGFAAHPLVDGETLYCVVGGKGSVAVAFDKHTGQERWRALSAREPGYCAPSLITAGGRKQLLIWHVESLNSLNPETGKLFWSVPLRPSYGMSIIPPLRYGDCLFASGIGPVAVLLRLDPDKPAVKEVWRGKPKTALYSATCAPIIVDGVIYGATCRRGSLVAARLETGERLWETFQPTTGSRRAWP